MSTEFVCARECVSYHAAETPVPVCDSCSDGMAEDFDMLC